MLETALPTLQKENELLLLQIVILIVEARRRVNNYNRNIV
jgi:hypothetical protein